MDSLQGCDSNGKPELVDFDFKIFDEFVFQDPVEVPAYIQYEPGVDPFSGTRIDRPFNPTDSLHCANSATPSRPWDSAGSWDSSEVTVCPSPGHNDDFPGPKAKLHHSDTYHFLPLAAPKPPRESPTRRNAPRSKSRNRQTSGDGGEDLQLESEGGWDGKKPGLRHNSLPEPKLNCPFYLKDPAKHHKCSRLWVWKNLREHLFRKHRQPAKKTRDRLGGETTCSGAAIDEPFGITKEQEYAIRRVRRGKRMSLEDVWFEIWRIIFPDSSCPLPHFLIQRPPEDDKRSLTEADFRLLSSEEFRLWVQSFPGMSSVDEDQRAEICKELIQTFNSRRLGQDIPVPLAQVSQQEDSTDKDATPETPAANQGEPVEFLQDLEYLGDVFGDSPLTSSVASSPDAETEPPLFDSIRRILSADPSYAAEDVISAIKKRSDGNILALTTEPGSESPIIDSLKSEAQSGQECTSRGTNKRSIGASGPSETPANKKQKTCTPCDADGVNEERGGSNDDAGVDGGGTSEDGDEVGEDGEKRGSDGDGGGDEDRGSGGGGGGGGTTPPHTPDESSGGWICPYCLKFVEITSVKGFKACGRPGFRSRDQLRTHLQRIHSPEAEGRPKTLKKDLAQYYMSAQQWTDVKGVMDNIKRPQKKKHGQEWGQVWLQVQKTWFSKVWAILFPSSQYEPDSPFHTSNEELKERCHQVVKAMMDIEYYQFEARNGPSSQDAHLFTRLQVQEMLDKALQIGLDSLPIAAQHFGHREPAENTRTEPESGAAATTPEDEAAGGTPDGTDTVTPNTQATTAETEGSSTPENNLVTIPKSVTPQAQPSQTALGTQQVLLQKASEVLLETDGRGTLIYIRFDPRNLPQATGQVPVARVEVSAPSTFSINIQDPRDMPFTAPPTLPANIENPHNVQATTPSTFPVNVDDLLCADFGDFNPEWLKGMDSAMET